MKLKSLLVMVLIAALAIVAAVWVSNSRSPATSTTAPGLLAPGLGAALPGVRRVRIVAAGDSVLATLERGDGGWVLAEKHGYPVDADKLRALVSAIATARRVEAKTALATRHARIGVEDIADPDARGVRVDIEAAEQTWSLIFGDNPVRGSGTYARVADEPQSWLIDQSIAVERDPANWLRKRIIDVGANRVSAVAITPVEGAAFGLQRQDDDAASDFALDGVPRGREPANGYEREALAGILSGLNFEDVFAAVDQPVPEKVQLSQFTLEDGRVLRIESWPEDGRTLARFTMSVDEARAAAWRSRPMAQADAGEAAGVTDADAVAADDAAALAARFQREHADWVYVLPAYKASNLGKGLEDYLKPRS